MMHRSESRETPRFSARTGRKLIGGVSVAGVILAGIIVLVAPAMWNTRLIVWTVGGALAFSVISVVLRLLVARRAVPVFLVGRIPLSLMLSKVVGLVMLTTLFLLWLIALPVGQPLSELAGAALLTGLVVAAALSIATTGMMNLLLVYRYLTGTLAETSRPIDERA